MKQLHQPTFIGRGQWKGRLFGFLENYSIWGGVGGSEGDEVEDVKR